MAVPRFVQALQTQLSAPLPGGKAHDRMAPVPRPSIPESRQEKDAIPSAVLILLCRKDAQWYFILTERSSQVEHHQGQVSLPGGAREDGESAEQTALRETEEELGIPRGKITVVGRLSPLFIPVSGFRVQPVVGWSAGNPDVTPDPVEVAAVHFASVSELLNEGSVRRETRRIQEKIVDVPFFQFGTVQVWGATALILEEFREVLKSVEKEAIFDETG